MNSYHQNSIFKRNIDLLQFPMGNDSSHIHQHPLSRFYRSQDWNTLTDQPTHTLKKHKYTHEMVEVYHLPSLPNKKQLDIYHFRSQQEDLIKVFFVVANKAPFLCGGQPNAEVLVQHIPCRLRQIDSISVPQALTILISALRGFRCMENQFGVVEPSENLIGFNSQGKTKVWLSQQPQLNRRDQDQQGCFFDSPMAQCSRIKNMFCLIQLKTVGNLLPNSLTFGLFDRNLDYQKMISIVQRYAKDQRISLRQYLKRQRVGGKSSVANIQSQVGKSSINGVKKQQPLLKRISSSGNLHKHHQKKVSDISISSQSSYHPLQNIMYQSKGQKHIRLNKPIARQTLNITFQQPRTPYSYSKQYQKQIVPSYLEHANFRKPTLIDDIYCGLEQKTVNRSEKKDIRGVYNFDEEDKNASQVFEIEVEEQKKRKTTQQKGQMKQQRVEIEKESCLQQKDLLKLNILTEDPVVMINRVQRLKQSEQIRQIASQEIIVASSAATIDPIEASNKQPEKVHEETEDFLDINILSKKLEKKFSSSNYSNPTTPQIVKEDEDHLHISKLEQGLLRFEQSQSKISKQLTENEGNSTVRSKDKEKQPKAQEIGQLIQQQQHIEQGHSKNACFQQSTVCEYKKNSISTNLYSEELLTKPRSSTYHYLNYPSSSSNYQHSRYHSKTINPSEQYLSSKELRYKYLREARNKGSHRQDSSYADIASLRNKKGYQRPHSPKVTYEDLRSILRTDL